MFDSEKLPVLYIVIPCYNEEEVLPVTSVMFLQKLRYLSDTGKISDESRILFVDDGSVDGTWEYIRELSRMDPHYRGISLSRNRGHQNALLAGLMEARDQCDITISIDCDGQDDIDAMDRMIEEYQNGCEIVYGVRSDRDTDSFFKRSTAQSYYRILKRLGGEIVYNHADYRLVSARVLQEFSNFREVNIFLRGMFPMVGFRSTCVYYERHERLAGTTHYPLSKMLKLAFDGITSLSVRPIRFITGLGIMMTGAAVLLILIMIVILIKAGSIAGTLTVVTVSLLIGGVQLISLGIVGEYIGKIYLEPKKRPRYIVSGRTDEGNREKTQKKRDGN